MKSDVSGSHFWIGKVAIPFSSWEGNIRYGTVCFLLSRFRDILQGFVLVSSCGKTLGNESYSINYRKLENIKLSVLLPRGSYSRTYYILCHVKRLDVRPFPLNEMLVHCKKTSGYDLAVDLPQVLYSFISGLQGQLILVRYSRWMALSTLFTLDQEPRKQLNAVK